MQGPFLAKEVKEMDVPNDILYQAFYSYVMGIDNSINELKNHGFLIENDGDNYMVTFSKENATIWEEFVKKHLEVGYWNEYLTDNSVVFLFHLQDGIKRYEVYDFIDSDVLGLCENLCECKFESLKSMLMRNHFYKKVLSQKEANHG